MAGAVKQMNKTQVDTRYALITAILVWYGLVVVSSLYVTIPMSSILARQFKVSTAYAAWSGSSFSLAYALGFLFFGPLADIYGRKRMMVSGLVALSIITLILGTANSLPWIIILH